MKIAPGTQIGPNGTRVPINKVDGIVVDRPSLIQVYGEPGANKVVKWNPTTSRPEWTDVDRNMELGYAEIIANVTGITSTAGMDIPGLTTTVTVGTRPIAVVVHIPMVFFTAGVAPLSAVFLIFEDGTLVGRGQVVLEGTGTTRVGTVRGFARRAPAAGQHTYKVQVVLAGAGATAQINASATGPASISVVER